MKNKTKLTAVKFRLIAISLFIVVLVVAVGGFILGRSYLQDVAQNTREHQADADASEDNLSNLQLLKSNLNKQGNVIQNLQSFYKSGAFLQFSTEESLTTIAKQTGVRITNINFVNDEGANGSNGSAQPTDGAQQSQLLGSNSQNSKISFEIDGDISYKKFINFLYALETSTPKLEIEGISVSSVKSGKTISVDPIGLELASKGGKHE